MIVAVGAERATGHEGDALPALIARARLASQQVLELCADQGYAGKDVYRELDALGVVAFIPPQATRPRRAPKPRPPARAARPRPGSAPRSTA